MRSNAALLRFTRDGGDVSGIRTNAAAEILGVSPNTLRSWERRFGYPKPRRTQGGHRQYDLAELEALRDELAERLSQVRTDVSRQADQQASKRLLIEHMLLEPERHKWEIVSNEDIGERGCKHWHVRPRYGILGMFLNWWRVRISSGCPLAVGCGPWP